MIAWICVSGKWQVAEAEKLEGAAPAAQLCRHPHKFKRSDRVQTHSGSEKRDQQGWRPLPATPRRPLEPRPLLPSGPGGVDGLATRGDRQGPPLKLTRPETAEDAKLETGGERGIRTLEAGFSRLHTFQACSFNRSDISPHSLLAMLDPISIRHQRARNHSRFGAIGSMASPHFSHRSRMLAPGFAPRARREKGKSGKACAACGAPARTGGGCSAAPDGMVHRPGGAAARRSHQRTQCVQALALTHCDDEQRSPRRKDPARAAKRKAASDTLFSECRARKPATA